MSSGEITEIKENDSISERASEMEREKNLNNTIDCCFEIISMKLNKNHIFDDFFIFLSIFFFRQQIRDSLSIFFFLFLSFLSISIVEIDF